MLADQGARARHQPVTLGAAWRLAQFWHEVGVFLHWDEEADVEAAEARRPPVQDHRRIGIAGEPGHREVEVGVLVEHPLVPLGNGDLLDFRHEPGLLQVTLDDLRNQRVGDQHRRRDDADARCRQAGLP